MIKIEVKGSTEKMEKFLHRMLRREQFNALEKYGLRGVTALQAATPKDSSETANGWYYEVSQKPGVYTISWHNRHLEDGVPVAILLQYGHGTGTGGYVEGRDFINPAMRPIFDDMARDMWKVVTK